MSMLLEHARALVANLESMPGIDPSHYAELKRYLEDKSTMASAAEIEEARAKYATGDDLEVDETAFASRADDGLWVQAWVWLPRPDTF